MTKRCFDFFISLAIFIFLSPLFLIVSILVFFNDFQSPFYLAKRVGIGGVEFIMIKFRSMREIVSLNHLVSTSENDPRITPIGRLIRKYKIDEFPQLFNVILGNMTFVGPRPNVKVEVDLYSDLERQILTQKPGITDISSIVFSDLNQILSKADDPNITYNQLIRPWKNKLALFQIQHSGFLIELKIIFFTAINLISRKYALLGIRKLLIKLDAPAELVDICKADRELIPQIPPGEKSLVTKEFRDGFN